MANLKKSLLAMLAAALAPACLLAHTSLLSIPSRHIDSPAQVSVTTPDNYHAFARAYPTVYLLHGHGGNHTSWSNIANLDSLANIHQIIIVCPDGRNSWYWDSPLNPSMQMESYITRDLIPAIDSLYATAPVPEMRAITGLSMGGHGALWLAIRHPELFRNAGSTSGGVDIVPFPGRWNINDALGPQQQNPERWETHSVRHLVETGKLKPGQLNIIFDCGTSDFFLKVNQNLHRILKSKSITHTFLTSPGTHNNAYWRKSINPQLEFFKKQFNR